MLERMRAEEEEAAEAAGEGVSTRAATGMADKETADKGRQNDPGRERRKRCYM